MRNNMIRKIVCIFVYIVTSFSSISFANDLREHWNVPNDWLFVVGSNNQAEINAQRVFDAIQETYPDSTGYEIRLKLYNLAKEKAIKLDALVSGDDIVSLFDLDKSNWLINDLGLLNETVPFGSLIGADKIVASILGIDGSVGPSELQIATELIIEAINQSQQEIINHFDSVDNADLRASLTASINEFKSYNNFHSFTARWDNEFRTQAIELDSSYLTEQLAERTSLDSKQFVKRLSWMMLSYGVLSQAQAENYSFATTRTYLGNLGLDRPDYISLSENQLTEIAIQIEEKVKLGLGTLVGIINNHLENTDQIDTNDSSSRNLWRKAHDIRFTSGSNSWLADKYDEDTILTAVKKYFPGSTGAKKSSSSFIGVESTNIFSYYIDNTRYQGKLRQFTMFGPQNECLAYVVTEDVYGDILFKSREMIGPPGTGYQCLYVNNILTTGGDRISIATLNQHMIDSHKNKTYPIFIQDAYGPIRKTMTVWAASSGVERTELSIDTIYDEWSGDLDSDGDGLTNAQEQHIGTSIANIDSDKDSENNIVGDGIDDYFEYNTAFLNPLDSSDALLDQDNDGYNNLAEYQGKSRLDDPNSTPETVKRDAVMVAINFLLLN